MSLDEFNKGEKNTEEKFIPKHRFDCINLSLKEHKLQVVEQKKQIQQLQEKINIQENSLKKARKLFEQNILLKKLIKLLLPDSTVVDEDFFEADQECCNNSVLMGG